MQVQDYNAGGSRECHSRSSLCRTMPLLCCICVCVGGGGGGGICVQCLWLSATCNMNVYSWESSENLPVALVMGGVDTVCGVNILPYLIKPLY